MAPNPFFFRWANSPFFILTRPVNVLCNLILTLIKLGVLLILVVTALGFGLCGAVGLPQAMDNDGINWGIVFLSLIGLGIMWQSIAGFRKLRNRFFPPRSSGRGDDSRL